ncbi:hypothetical protein ACH5RR_028825 [Cinchona calisaya]|uniref:Cell wall protein n=1 Tax=Cinchona calisaya TaxID=153742 RepID=A0ABD2YTG4_9GENT
MASKLPSIATFLLIFNILLISSGLAISGRKIPTQNPNHLDKKQPQSFIGNDGSVLVPGFGRYMFPKKGSYFDPFTYNPVTGTSGGNGFNSPGSGGDTGSSAGGHSYVPGGDDTNVPNPGFEVPVGGSVPLPSGP